LLSLLAHLGGVDSARAASQFSISPEARADLIAAQVDALAHDAKWRRRTVALAFIPMGIAFAATGSILINSTSVTDRAAGYFGLGFGGGMALAGGLALFLKSPMERTSSEIFEGSSNLSGQAKLD